LKLASISDLELVEKAREGATSLFISDPELNQEEHQVLANAVEQFWGKQVTGDIS